MGSRWIAIAAAAAGLALAGAGALVVERLSAPKSLFTVVSVGAQRLSFASGYVRRRDDGAAELVAFLPDFAPAAGFADLAATTDLDDRFARVVFVGLKPADPEVDPAERMERLYQRFLDENSWSHPGGLTARAFVEAARSRATNCTIEPEGREFAARCHRPDRRARRPAPASPTSASAISTSSCASPLRSYGNGSR